MYRVQLVSEDTYFRLILFSVNFLRFHFSDMTESMLANDLKSHAVIVA